MSFLNISVYLMPDALGRLFLYTCLLSKELKLGIVLLLILVFGSKLK